MYQLPKSYLLSILVSSSLLSACGGGASSSDLTSNQDNPAETGGNPPTSVPSQPNPDEDNPQPDHIVVLKENQAVTAPLASLGTDLEDPAYVLQLQSNGFPNLIQSIITEDGIAIVDQDKIDELFNLFINPVTGEVEVKVNKKFDFESDSSSYLLAIKLGTEEISVQVDLYDIQKGTEQEALKISNYDELRSFFDGTFVSANIGNDALELSNPMSDSHNSDRLYIELDRDIDASASAQTPWVGAEFDGFLNGKKFVISNLTTATGENFIDNPGGQGYTPTAVVRNIGFVDVNIDTALIRSSNYSSELNSVFISGQVKSTGDKSFNFSPFNVSSLHKKIYTNLRYDLTSLTTYTPPPYHSTPSSRISALFGGSSSGAQFSSGYSNGSIHTRGNLKADLAIHGLTGLGTLLLEHGEHAVDNSLFYSAIDFEVSQNQALLGENYPYIRYGAIGDQYLNYPSNDTRATDYNWRYVVNRNNTGRTTLLGNASQDTNNDGIADGAGSGPDLSDIAMTEEEIKNHENFSGRWLAADSDFDITNGEYPVLKGMPYPHIEGASWMSAEDPGIAYQRATYDDYLAAPEIP